MADKNKTAPVAKKKSYSVHTMFENGKKKNKDCPKCGPGVALSEHKDRRSCGKCGYSERK